MPESPRRLGRLARDPRTRARESRTTDPTGGVRVPGSLTVEVSRGGCAAIDADDRCTVLGHSLNRARRRYLRQAEWIVAIDDTGPVGLAAYHRVESDVRLVLEFLLDQTLSESYARRVTDLLLSTVERLACDSGARCLMFMLGGDVTLKPFERRGYQTVGVDSAGSWVQKRLDAVKRPRALTRRTH